MHFDIGVSNPHFVTFLLWIPPDSHTNENCIVQHFSISPTCQCLHFHLRICIWCLRLRKRNVSSNILHNIPRLTLSQRELVLHYNPFPHLPCSSPDPISIFLYPDFIRSSPPYSVIDGLRTSHISKFTCPFQPPSCIVCTHAISFSTKRHQQLHFNLRKRFPLASLMLTADIRFN